MLVRNTFQTLFEVTDTGLKLRADFVTKSEADEWAADNQVMSYLVMETVVMHEVTIETRVQPSRALRVSGDAVGPGEEPLQPRSGPITGVRPGAPADSKNPTKQNPK